MPSSSVLRRIFLLVSSSASSASLSHAHPRTHNRSSRHRRTPDLSPPRPCSLLMVLAEEVVVVTMVVVVVAMVMVVVEESVPPYPPKHKHRDRVRIQHVLVVSCLSGADNLFLSLPLSFSLARQPPCQQKERRRGVRKKGTRISTSTRDTWTVQPNAGSFRIPRG